MSPLDYEQSGVRYDVLDAFKRACQKAARGTASALASHNLAEPPGVRGESAYLIDAGDSYLAHVEEGLGTKNLVADAMERLTGRCFYRAVGIDTVATIVNDLVTCGALPISVAMHAAVGDSSWFESTRRSEELARGFAEGCIAANAVWGGGETPALKGIVEPGAIVLAGSAIGRIRPRSNRIVGDVRDGDSLVFVASSGVHTNGLTLCRAVAERVEGGYLAPLADGRPYGEALLDASMIYVRLVQACQEAGVTLRYAAHVTGHGWRKLMRLDEPFVYRVTEVRPAPPVFRFLIDGGHIDEREAYNTFNMGVGFVLYVRPEEAARAVELAGAAGHEAWVAGSVRKEGDRKAVEIEPLGIRFDGASLRVR